MLFASTAGGMSRVVNHLQFAAELVFIYIGRRQAGRADTMGARSTECGLQCRWHTGQKYHSLCVSRNFNLAAAAPLTCDVPICQRPVCSGLVISRFCVDADLGLHLPFPSSVI